MNHASAPRHVLIDFENRPKTDLAALAGLDVEVTLLAGAKNKRFDVELVDQLLAAGPRAHLVRLDVSGRNALDITLAYYLGRAAAENPRAEFFVVSADKDYEPMLAHVRQLGVRAERCASVEDLPFLPRPASAPRIPAAPKETRLDTIIEQLRVNARGRPGTERRLRGFLNSRSKIKRTDAELAHDIAELTQRGLVAIDDRGRVTYALGEH